MSRRLTIGVAIALASFSVAGCPGGDAGTSAPSAAPSGTPTATPSSPQEAAIGTILVDGRGNMAAGVTVKVQRDSDFANLSGALVSLAGPIPGWGTTNSLGVSFSQLATGSYSLRVSATGYATRTYGPLDLGMHEVMPRTIVLASQGGQVMGQVSGNGAPIAGARVSAGECWAFTGTDGRFILSGLPKGDATLIVAKGGYTPQAIHTSLNGQDVSIGTISLAAATLPIFCLENGSQVFDGTTIATALEPMTTALISAGYGMTTIPSAAGVRIVASPRADWLAANPAEVETLRQFALNGGTLIVMGDWGGSYDYSPDAANALLAPYALAVNPDLVQSSQNAGQPCWVRAGAQILAGSHPVGTVTMFAAASLLVPPSWLTLAAAGSSGYRIAGGPDLSGAVLAAARPYGAGLVIALSDTSAWTAGSITGNAPGGTNLNETDNRGFMLDLAGW